MNNSNSTDFGALDPNVPRRPLLCRIVQMESAAGAKDLIVSCEIREGEFIEVADLMFLESDTAWLREFFEAFEMWIRVHNEVFPGQPIGNLKHQMVESPEPSRRSSKKRS